MWSVLNKERQYECPSRKVSVFPWTGKERNIKIQWEVMKDYFTYKKDREVEVITSKKEQGQLYYVNPKKLTQ